MTSERGVKITYDFLEQARKDRFQHILQAVENDRKHIPNQRKKHIRLVKKYLQINTIFCNL